MIGVIWPYIAGAIAAVVVYFGLISKGRRIERDKNELRRLKDSKETAERIDHAKPADNPDDARDNLRRWLSGRK